MKVTNESIFGTTVRLKKYKNKNCIHEEINGSDLEIFYQISGIR
jgi:hypothetical protein